MIDTSANQTRHKQMKTESHKYISQGTKYRFDITFFDVVDDMQVTRFVNDKFKSSETYSSSEYSFIRQCITDNMSALNAVRDWS